MPETVALAAEEKKPVASLGKVGTVQFNEQMIAEADKKSAADAVNKVAAPDSGDGSAGADAGAGGAATADTPIEFSTEQKKAFFKSIGIEYNGDEDIEAVKEKLKPAAATPSDAEKLKAENEREVKILEIFVAGGGSPEQYNLLKEIAKADPKEFSRKEIIADAIAAGFTKEEAEIVANERYYQIKIDELEPDFEEKPEDFEQRKTALKKKMEYGDKKLSSHSLYKQKQAGEILKNLAGVLDDQEKQKQAQEANVVKVTTHLKALPRKTTLELGKSNDKEIPPVEHEYAEESFAKVAELLKDPTKLNNLFFNQDGSLNLTSLTPVLLKSFELERVAKNALIVGQDRQVKEFQKVFPNISPSSLGVGGAPDKLNSGNKGTAVKMGKREVVQPNSK